jgi:hypothetical protein
VIERISEQQADDDDVNIVSVADEQACVLCAVQLHGALLAHAAVAVDDAVLCERVCVANCALFKWSQLNDALAEQVRSVNTSVMYGVQIIKNLLFVCRQQSEVCAPLVWRTARTIAHHELAHAARTRIVKRSAAFKLLAAYATAPTTDDEQLMRACDALLAHLQRTLDSPLPDDGDGECVCFIC